MKRIAAWLQGGLFWVLLWQLSVRTMRKLRPGPRPTWLEWDPVGRLRHLFWPPSRIVARLDVKPGMRVVEVGAGSGRLAVALAQAVGPGGQVLAVDERPGLLEDLRIAALEQDLAQVVVAEAPATALPAGAAGCDLIVLTATFGGLPEKQAATAEAYRRLRPGGAIAVTEFIVDPDASLTSTIVIHLVLSGFAIEREIGSFAARTVIGRKETVGSRQ